ncbi:hypothetical protein EJ03DRAFT_354095 [Teratosphaeria nubilosa]|uniref:Uncharacterized protein n=1 Tax=Teratosphaeria nubilosa TaxID=161662 RepID=A0A6G1L155_9PEZI|nr:hypothetical protein EJ03DRAFT_354095 [Teratosphaeria nubilosa]
MQRSNIIASSIENRTVQDDDSRGCGWPSVRQRVERMLQQVDYRTTIFIGAAASSFKPTAFPAWNKFVQLIYSSSISQAASDLPGDNLDVVTAHLNQCIAEALTRAPPAARVPNYKFTETIARRLGKDYLRLLQAFRCQRANSDTWVVNHVHEWAAQALVDQTAAAIVTTNFDDCIEGALENAGANTYRLTGDPHIDGAEILSRLPPPSTSSSSSRRLILVVNGPEACRFAQTLWPQVGQTFSMLFKLHGSCYAPETCIDTRLQRQQGLPSYAVDLLDHLLVSTVLYVVGFGGGDLNDNTDYLRMVHNRKHARLVWLQPVENEVLEPGVVALSRVLEGGRDASEGLCVLHGLLRGERVRWDEGVSEFERAVVDWCRGVGTAWCKLLVLDLVELCGATQEQWRSLEALGFVGSKRQDWNAVVERHIVDGGMRTQLEIAKQCASACEILQGIRLDGRGETPSVCEQLDRLRLELKRWHLHAAQDLSTHQPHAQAWVISALYGLTLFHGQQRQAAGEALAFAQNAAFLVGDLQSHQALKSLLSTLTITNRTPAPLPSTPTSSPSTAIHAFIPALDNVNSKANLYGVPPALFLRALLHRAMLFADKIIVSSNVIVNSNVFVSEILFGGRDVAEAFYLHAIRPIVVHEDPDMRRPIMGMYQRVNARAGYISERIPEVLVARLDEWFEDAAAAAAAVEGEDPFIRYREAAAARNYTLWMRRAVGEMRAMTREHLLSYWRHLRTRNHHVPADLARLDEAVAEEMIETVLSAVDAFTRHLSGEHLTRSQLYNLAGLFATIQENPVAIDQQLRPSTAPAVLAALAHHRASMLGRPWIAGPLCHELFDVPYQWNPIVHLATTDPALRGIVFLEEHERASAAFMARLAGGGFRVSGQAMQSVTSALLLGNASEADVVESRSRLAGLRRHLRARGALDPGVDGGWERELRRFERASVDVGDVTVRGVAVVAPEVEERIVEFLRLCVFLVRKGEPLDRMYAEPQLMLPGLMRLESG